MNLSSEVLSKKSSLYEFWGVTVVSRRDIGSLVLEDCLQLYEALTIIKIAKAKINHFIDQRTNIDRR
jgi:hypothetical protein